MTLHKNTAGLRASWASSTTACVKAFSLPTRRKACTPQAPGWAARGSPSDHVCKLLQVREAIERA
jgi:hypothetical protein